MFPGTLLAGGAIFLLLLACSLMPAAIAPYSPTQFDFRALLKPPSPAHPFGTDNFGRDILSRTIWAAQVDLQIALFSTVFAALFGTLVGSVLGYVGGWADAVFRRIVDVLITIPFLVLVIVIVAVLGPGLRNMYIAISAVNWIIYARLMRGEVMAQAQRDYAAAGRVMGYGTLRIIFRHLLPNAISPMVVYWMTDMALAILLGSSLGYLGLGAQPPTAEWGVLIADGRNFITTRGGCRFSPASPSSLPASGSACWATAWPPCCGGLGECEPDDPRPDRAAGAGAPVMGSTSMSAPARRSGSSANPVPARA